MREIPVIRENTILLTKDKTFRFKEKIAPGSLVVIPEDAILIVLAEPLHDTDLPRSKEP